VSGEFVERILYIFVTITDDMQFLAGAVFLTRPVRGVCPLGTLFNFIILSGVCTIALHISSLRFSTCLQLMERFYNLRNPEGPVALELPVGRGISNKMLRLRFLTIEISYILSSSILLSDFQMSTFTILWMKVTPISAYLVLVYRRSSRRHHARLAHPLSHSCRGPESSSPSSRAKVIVSA
jgi:hypothetical protein